ncbi:MAG: NlpC/P60 family protein [Oceanicaulis sp.]
MATVYQVTSGIAPIRRTPQPDGPQDTQLLAGETFTVEREENGFGYGTSGLDGYQGWVDMEALSAPALIPTHQVKALRTYVFSEPDIKSAPVCLISLNAKIVGARRSGRFVEAQRMGWVIEAHLRPVGEDHEADWVAVAERFLNAPYFWGGKESLGLDCSGLIQTAMEAAGRLIPRDSGPQEAWAKERWTPVEIREDFSGLQRGDLVFWPGHVGVMTDAETLLHANGHHMMTVAEPLARAAKRIAHQYAPMSGIYRDPGRGGHG